MADELAKLGVAEPATPAGTVRRLQSDASVARSVSLPPQHLNRGDSSARARTRTDSPNHQPSEAIQASASMRMEPLLTHDGVNPRALDSVRTNSFLEGSKRPKNEPPKSQKDKDAKKRSSKEAEKQLNTEMLHKLFKLPESEQLLTDIGASLVRAINLVGRLYVLENHICFYSSFLGIKTMEKWPVDDIAAIQAEMDENIAITVNNTIFSFTSFRGGRDQVLQLLQKGWKRQLKDSPALTAEQEEDDDAISFAIDGYLTGPNESAFLSTTVQLKELIRTELPIGVPRAFKYFFADDSQFSQMYHDARSDKEFQAEKWMNSPLGNIRQLRYVAPVRNALGPKETRMTETQRYSLQREHLIVETTKVLHDIPYGDYFTIEGRWDFTQVAPKRSLLVVTIGLNFSKKTIFASKIESSTLKECKESYEKWVRLAEEFIHKNKRPSSRLAPSTKVCSSPAPSTPVKESPAPSFLAIAQARPWLAVNYCLLALFFLYSIYLFLAIWRLSQRIAFLEPSQFPQ